MHAKTYSLVSTIIIIICALLIPVFAFAAKGTPLVQPGDKIVTFGDSISTGNGYGYLATNLLNAEHPDWQLTWVGRGYPGWTSEGALKVIDDVIAEKPDLVTIMFGTNDIGMAGSRGITYLQQNLRNLVRPLKKAGIRVVLLTTPYVSNSTSYSRELNQYCLPRMGDEIFALGRKEKVPVFDMFTAMKAFEQAGLESSRSFMMFNGPGDAHPNAIGHAGMARALANFLAGQGQLKRPPFRLRYDKPQAVAAETKMPINFSANSIWPADSTPMRIADSTRISSPSSWKTTDDLSAVAYAAWDKEKLYLSVAVSDPDIVIGEKQPAWGYDGIEFFFDTRPTKKRDVAYSPGYTQLMVAVMPENGAAIPDSGRADPFDDSTVTATSQLTEKGYLIQLAIPWPSLNFRPKKGANLGFDYTIINRKTPPAASYIALWRGAGFDYINAGCLGSLILK